MPQDIYMHKKGMIFLQYGGESRLNFIENLCEMVVSSLMYMIKFCEGFVADIFFFIIFMLLWMSRYLHKSENKTWIPKNKISVLTLITLNNIRKGNGSFVGKTLWKYLFKSQMIGTLLLRIINIPIGILKSNYLCSTNVHVGFFHQFAN